MLALDGGSDGLNFYRTLKSAITGTKKQTVLLEIGFDQAKQVQTIFHACAPLPRFYAVQQDLGSNDRVCVFSFEANSTRTGSNSAHHS